MSTDTAETWWLKTKLTLRNWSMSVEDQKRLIAAVAARERELVTARKLISEVMRGHRDPQAPDYNECEKDPCAWCEEWLAAQSKEPRS